MSNWTPIVGKRFTPDEFDKYVTGLQLTDWSPVGVVLHNTAVPSLAQRPNGFTSQHMKNLEAYYRDTMKWRSSPHLFIDDLGIWVFNPLTRRGTHSPSWNATHFGVEMLGDFDREAFHTGRGAQVRDNSVRAVAALLAKIGKGSEAVRLHKDDPQTDHDCPGRNVVRADFLGRVEAALSASRAWTVVIAGQERITTDTGVVRFVAEALGATLHVQGKRITVLPARGK